MLSQFRFLSLRGLARHDLRIIDKACEPALSCSSPFRGDDDISLLLQSVFSAWVVRLVFQERSSGLRAAVFQPGFCDYIRFLLAQALQ